MNISELIEKLQDIKSQYGDLPVCHYNNMSYHRELLGTRGIGIEVEKLKRHIDKNYADTQFVDPDTRWLSGQKKFDAQECIRVVTL